MKVEKVTSNNLSKIIDSIEEGYIQFNSKQVQATERIVKDVLREGDEALFRYTKKFDGFEVNSKNLVVTKDEIKDALERVPKGILESLQTVAKRIEKYQTRLLPKPCSFKDEFGNELGWEVRTIDRVGIYVPGGTASYPSTVLMTAIPARVAGVSDISIVTPCHDGVINPAVLAAASICGVDRIYKVGGAQAVAALAYGTDLVDKVDKIVGPGNIYVTIAKKIVYGTVDIDSLAGPSEVLVIADGSCPASWVAADLLAQAEHDEMSVPTLITTSSKFADGVKKDLCAQLSKLQRAKIAKKSIMKNGRIYIVKNLDLAAFISNRIAPEHLELCVKAPKKLLRKIAHAGAIFVGAMSSESFGDYVSGPSHVLPTGGASRFSSPLSVYDFVTLPSVICMSKKGFKELSNSVINLAYSEGLEAHALSVKVRI